MVREWIIRRGVEGCQNRPKAAITLVGILRGCLAVFGGQSPSPALLQPSFSPPFSATTPNFFRAPASVRGAMPSARAYSSPSFADTGPLDNLSLRNSSASVAAERSPLLSVARKASSADTDTGSLSQMTYDATMSW